MNDLYLFSSSIRMGSKLLVDLDFLENVVYGGQIFHGG